jgi:hypothetical protein
MPAGRYANRVRYCALPVLQGHKPCCMAAHKSAFIGLPAVGLVTAVLQQSDVTADGCMVLCECARDSDWTAVQLAKLIW